MNHCEKHFVRYDACSECADELRKRIAELEAERRWIPVSKLLPPEEENVLCYFEKGEHDVSCWFRSSREKKGVWMCGVPPKYWMPLPKAPEVSDE